MTHRPAVILVSAFMSGIILLHSFGVAPLVFILLGVSAALLVLSWPCRSFFASFLCVFLCSCGAFAAWNNELLSYDHISRDLGSVRGADVAAVCRVASLPEHKAGGLAPKQVFLCDLEAVNGGRRSGRVMVDLYGTGSFLYGDRVRLTGKLSKPFDFSPGARMSYRVYLARQKIHAVLHVRKAADRALLSPSSAGAMDGMLMAARVHLEDVFRRYLSPGEAGLMNAMLLGPRGGIAPHVYEIFRKTGTAHVIAISGMNMTLTAFGMMFFLGLFNVPRRRKAVLAVVLLGLYSCMAGNSAPVARSALMAGVVILSFIIERESDVLNSLAFAMLVLLAVDPGQVMDIGFQLSFVCVAALVLVAPLLLQPFEAARWRENKVAWFFIESGAVTLAAFIGSAGILAYDFGYLTPIGLLVNLPVIPVMALVTALGAAVLVAGSVLPFLAWPFALCLKVVLNGVIAGLALASRVPVIVYKEIPIIVVLLYYVVLVLIIWSFCRRSMANGPFIDKPLPL